MRRLLLLPALILIVIGIVLALQGSDVLRGSSMSGQPVWEVVGIVFIVVGLILGWFGAVYGRPRTRV